MIMEREQERPKRAFCTIIISARPARSQVSWPDQPFIWSTLGVQWSGERADWPAGPKMASAAERWPRLMCLAADGRRCERAGGVSLSLGQQQTRLPDACGRKDARVGQASKWRTDNLLFSSCSPASAQTRPPLEVKVAGNLMNQL